MTESLEEELRVQQQKLLIQGKSVEKRFRSHHKEKGQYSKQNAHLTDAAKSDSKCYFCDENENDIATKDLNNIKLYITLHVKNSYKWQQVKGSNC